MFSGINFLAVIVATIASFFLGGLWFSGALFAKPWIAGMQKHTGKSKEQMMKESTPMNYVIAVLSSFLMAAVMAYLLKWSTTIGDAVRLSLMIWVGFILSTMVVNGAFQNRPRSLVVIESFHHLASLILQTVILFYWK